MVALGRLVSHDERSRAYPARRAAPPRTVLWSHTAPILDQGTYSACTGFALAQCLNTGRFWRARPGRRYFDADDALALYSAATRLDEFAWEWPDQDFGSSGLGVAKAGAKAGYLSGYQHAFGLAHLLAALPVSPVIAGTAWTESMFEPDEAGFIRPDGETAGGHEFVVLGANLRDGYLTILNSWGAGWGDRGRARIRFRDMTTLLADRGDITVPIGKTAA